MKTFFEDLGRKIGETAEIVTNKAGEAVEIQRLRNQIRALERGNERDYLELGRTIYENYRNGELTDEEAVSICEAIQNREENIEKYEQQVSAVKGDVKCESCGKSVDKEMFYCPYCGMKVPEDAKKEAQEEGMSEADVQTDDVTAEDIREELKEKAEGMAADAVGKTVEAADAVKEKTEEAAEAAKEKSEEAVDAVKERTDYTADMMKERAAEAAGIMKEKAADIADVVKERTADTVEVIKEKAREAEEKFKSMTDK